MRQFKQAFTLSIPILCSYLFLSIAYGMVSYDTNISLLATLFSSTFIYTGAFQFVLLSYIKEGTSLLVMAMTALLMNSRQVFYGFTLLDEFKKYGKRKLYMIHSLTDETFALDCSIEVEEKDKLRIMFYIALLSHFYWIIGTFIGYTIGNLIPFSLEGIDFCMTAMFLTILVDQWQKKEKKSPAIIGIVCGIVGLLLFGGRVFILPSLIFASICLLMTERKQENV